MGLFSEDVLTDLGTLAGQLAFKDTATIERQASPRVRNPSGGYVDTWQAVHTDIPCAVLDTIPRSIEPFLQGQQVSEVQKTVIMPRLTDVLASDRLLIAGIYYEITAVIDPSSYEVLRHVIVERMGTGAR